MVCKIALGLLPLKGQEVACAHPQFLGEGGSYSALIYLFPQLIWYDKNCACQKAAEFSTACSGCWAPKLKIISFPNLE